MSHPLYETLNDYFDGERPTQPPESGRTVWEEDAVYEQIRAYAEREANSLAYWIGLFDDVALPLDVEKLGRELHKAWVGGTVTHPLRDVALDHVESVIAMEIEEALRA